MAPLDPPVSRSLMYSCFENDPARYCVDDLIHNFFIDFFVKSHRILAKEIASSTSNRLVACILTQRSQCTMVLRMIPLVTVSMI